MNFSNRVTGSLRPFIFALCFLAAAGCQTSINSLKPRGLLALGRNYSVSLPQMYLRGGETVALTLSMYDPKSTYTSIDVEYSLDGGTTYSAPENFPVSGSSQILNWNVPSLDASGVLLRFKMLDTSGSEDVATPNTIAIMTTPPVAPALTRTSANPANSLAATFTAASCAGRAALFLSENATTPLRTDAGWQSCTTTASATSTLLSSGDGTKTIYAWSKDLAGNISLASTSTTTVVDLTLPALTLDSLTGGEYFAGASSHSITWTASDIHLAANPISLDYSTDGGSTWTSIVTGLANSGTYSWTLPSINSTTARVRVSALDTAGNSRTQSSSSNFAIDSTAPAINITAVTGPLKGGATQALNWSVTETNASMIQTFLIEKYDGSSWTTLSTVPAANGPLSAQAFSENWTVDSWNTTAARIRITFTDLAGNASTATSGAFTVDSTAPIVTPTFPSGVIAGGVSRSISFSFSDAGGAGLATTAKLQYAADGTTFTDVSTTIPTGDTSYNWSVPSANVATAKLRFIVTDAAGNSTTSTSSAFTIDTAAPVVTLTSLTGGGSVRGGTTTPITWTATDANFGANPIALEVSSDSGASWSSLSAAEANDGTYTWSVPAATDLATYRVRVTATDSVGHTTTAASSGNFIVDSTPPTLTASAMNINSGAPATSNNFVRVSLQGTDNLSPISEFCLKTTSSAPAANDACWRSVAANPPGLTPAITLNLSNYYFMTGFVQGIYTVHAWVRDSAGNASSLTAAGSGTTGTDIASITYNPGEPPSIVDVLATNTDAPDSPPSQAQLQVAAGGNVYVKWKLTDVDPLPSNPVTIRYSTDDSTWTTIATGLTNGQNGACTIDHPSTAADDNATGCYLWSGGAPSSTFRIRIEAENTQTMIAYGGSVYLNASTFRVLAGNTDSGLGASAKAAVLTPDRNWAMPGSFVVLPDGQIFIRDNRGILHVSPTDGRMKLLIPTTGARSGDGGSASSATLVYATRIALDYSNNVLIWDYDRIRKLDTSTMQISHFIGGGPSTGDNLNPTDVAMQGTYYPDAMTFIPLPNGDLWLSTVAYNGTVAADNCLRHYVASTGKVMKACFQSSVGNGLYNEGGDTLRGNVDLINVNLLYTALEFNPTTSAITNIISVMNYWDNSYAPGGPGDWGACWDQVCSPNVRIDPTTFMATSGPHPSNITGAGYGAWWGNRASGMNTVGRDGKIYLIPVPGYDGYVYRTVRRFNSATNNWDTIVGNGEDGYCADGQDVSTCPLRFQDVFVTTAGQMYLYDNGTIRLIDGNNKFVTVAGQYRSSGDGVSPTSARFSNIREIHLWNDGGNAKFMTFDKVGCDVKEFGEAPGDQITRIIGAGFSSAEPIGGPANGHPLYCGLTTTHGVDPTNGDFYAYQAGHLAKVNRSNGLWSSVAGYGSTNWMDPASDGMLGNATTFTDSAFPVPVAYGNGKVLISHRKNNGAFAAGQTALKLYTKTDGTQSHLLGVQPLTINYANVADYCADGTASTSCPVQLTDNNYQTTGKFDPYSNLWILGHEGTNYFVSVPDGGGTVHSVATLPRNVNAFDYRKDASHEVLYYCAQDRALYQYNVLTSTETLIPFPVPGMYCGSVIYTDLGGSRIVFGYEINGLWGVGQITNP